MNSRIVVATVVLLGSAAGVFAKDQDNKLPTCPVMNEEVIDINTHHDMPDGQRVYFCCGMCIDKYLADPAKYATTFAAQKAALKNIPRVQVTCPVSGNPIDRKVSIDYQGHQIYFCCPKCVSSFEADPGKYHTKLLDSMTFQINCPVSGDPIDPASFDTLPDGGQVYYCCGRCKGKLAQDPGKYGKNLPSFYLCDNDKCKDSGSLKAGKCPKCGERRKAIGKGLSSR